MSGYTDLDMCKVQGSGGTRVPTMIALRRRGVVMWIVTGVALIMGALLFSYNMTVRQRHAQAHAVYYSQAAYGLAEATMNLAWLRLRKDLQDSDSANFLRIIETSTESLAGLNLPIVLDAPSVKRLVDGIRNIDMDTRARVVAAFPRHDTQNAVPGFHPAERRLQIEVTATARFRGITRRIVERRKVIAQLDVLPVLSRFTLFVTDPEIDDTVSPGYNRFANDINGRPDPTAPGTNYLPVVLYNHGDTFPRIDPDPQRSGWVFLGGQRDVRLNLTSGADYQYGQYFHFSPIRASSGATQAGFLNDSPPPFFTRTHSVGSLTHEYFLRHVIFGWFTIDAGTPPSDMNRDSVLAAYFDAGASMRSSTLNLFGTPICPSPTRVFGPVYHSYAIYSGITVDIDGDGRRDALVSLMPAIQPGEFSDLPHIAPIPSLVPNISSPGDTVELDPDLLCWTNVFGNDDTYGAYQSLIVDEPYNAGLDYLFGDGDYPPSSHVLDEHRDYPNPGENVTIRGEDHRGRPFIHFRGDLSFADGSWLRARTLVECADADEFLQRFIDSDGDLQLGTWVYVREGNLNLPPGLRVRRGGGIVAEGSITFDGVSCDPHERLVVASLRGDISSPFSMNSPANPAQVDLVAPRGRVGSTSSSRPVAIRGTIASRRFAPTDVPAGGSIVYPIEADPTAAPATRFLRLHFSEYPEERRF